MIRLNVVQRFALMKLIEAEYTQSNMSDAEFAEYAKNKTGHPYNKDHVNFARSEMGIASQRATRALVNKEGVEKKVEVLEANVELLTRSINAVIKTCSDVMARLDAIEAHLKHR